MQLFDTVLITAASEPQAEAFRRLIARRQDHGLYPRELSFEVVADPPGGRVGTGGGTLWALARLLERRGPADPAAFLESERILLVHAGGESRRLPTLRPGGQALRPAAPALERAAAAGRARRPARPLLQVPVAPRRDRGHHRPTSSSTSTSPACPRSAGPVFGFAKPASLEQGSRHGVFRFDQHRERVVDYFQKAPVEVLAEHALIEGTGDCALDIGLVSLGPGRPRAPSSPSARTRSTGARSRRGSRRAAPLRPLPRGADRLPGGPVLRGVLGAGGTRRARCPEDLGRRVYETFHPFGLGGALTRSTTFVHVGSLAEFPGACRDLLAHQARPFYEPDGGEIRPSVDAAAIVHNSVGGERRRVRARPSVEACSASSFRSARRRQPASSGLDGARPALRAARGGHPRRAAPRVGPGRRGLLGPGQLQGGRAITPTSSSAADPLDAWLEERGLVAGGRLRRRWRRADLFAARLFCCGPSAELIAGYLAAGDGGWTEAFRAARRLSLVRDPGARRRRAARGPARGAAPGAAAGSLPARPRLAGRERPGLRVHLRGDGDGPSLLREWLERTDDPVLRAYRERLYRTIAPEALAPRRGCPEIEYVSRGKDGPPLRLALKEDQIVWARAPVRLDLAGGWTDTPPYTLRHGGRVVNLAVDLNGQPPIQVFCRRTPERHVRIHSIDLGHTETFSRFEQLQDYNDPSSPFALPRAALCLMGLGGSRTRGRRSRRSSTIWGPGSRSPSCARCPRAPGLGTSSILGGGDAGRVLALLRPAGGDGRADPPGAPGGADAHHRRRLAGPDRRRGGRDQVRPEPARASARTRSSTSSTRSCSRTGRAWRASRSSTPASPAWRRTSWRRWWTR